MKLRMTIVLGPLLACAAVTAGEFGGFGGGGFGGGVTLPELPGAPALPILPPGVGGGLPPGIGVPGPELPVPPLVDDDWWHGTWRPRWRPRWRRGWRAGRWYYRSGYGRYQNPYRQKAPAKPRKPEPGSEDAEKAARKLLASARKAFKAGGYGKAFTEISPAVRLMPEDRTLREFRALAHFAQGRYKLAAEDLHLVLSSGPGWDWTTMIGLYGDWASYTKHLRRLEETRGKKPEEAATRFVLAYHYLTAGKTEAAAAELEVVRRLVPGDPVVNELSRMVGGGPDEPEAEVGDEEVPSLPESFDYKGTWRAKPPDGGEIVLTLTQDEEFTWSFRSEEESAEFSGEYDLDRSRVLLEDLREGALVGRITPDGADAFFFRVEGSPDDDPGLRFVRTR